MSKKPYDLPMTEFSSSRFSFQKDRRQLVAEISDLGNPRFQAIYSDACDVGIAVRSERTGRVVRFALSRSVCDAEGDVQCWELAPVDPDSGIINMTLFND